MNINIIFDCSGSMSVLGKTRILFSLYRFFSQYNERLRAATSENLLKLYLWNSSVTALEFNKSENLKKIICEGSSNVHELIKCINTVENEKFLLLSDGNFDYFEENNLNNPVFCVAVGCDYNELVLKKFSTNKKFYLVNDIYYVLENLFFI